MQESFQKSLLDIKLLCCSRSLSSKICINEKCKNHAFLCSDIQCICQKKHKGCKKTDIYEFYAKIQSKKQPLTDASERSYKILQAIYDELIQAFSEQRSKMIDEKSFYGLQNHSVRFMSLIQNGEQDLITGYMASAVSEQLIADIEVRIKSQQQIITDWAKQQTKILSIIQTLNSFTYYHLKEACLDSKIIDRQKSSIINNFFDNIVQDYRLIFRASEHQFSAHSFHQKCNKVENTLTLIQTEHKKVIGGFTPIAWSSAKQSKAETDPTLQSFLFSLQTKEKFPLLQKKYAIKNSINLGPTFGGSPAGIDLTIGDRCNTQYSSSTDFPTSYSNGRYNNRQKSYTILTGQKAGQVFRVKQYEIYQVIFTEQNNQKEQS